MSIRAGLPQSEKVSGPPCLLLDFVDIKEYKECFPTEETLVKT
jgi:hypothetical protein